MFTQKEKSMFLWAEILFCYCYLPGETEIPSLELVSGSRIDKGWVHTIPYFLFCERILSSFFFFQTKSSYCWTMTQAEKFPKHLKPENLCLESLKFMASTWRDWKKGQSSGRRWVDEGWWKHELWITSDFCHLTVCQAWGQAAVVPLRLCQWWLGSQSLWNSLPRAVMGFSSTIRKNAYGLTITKSPSEEKISD